MHARQSSNLLRCPLSVAAGYDDPAIRVFSLDSANGGPRVLVSGTRYSARVQDNNLGVFLVRRPGEATLQELPLDGRSIGLGRTAPEILDVESTHDGIVT